MKNNITIGIAEDHPLLRIGLVSTLKSHKQFKVLFDVGDGKKLLDQLKTEKPDILLLDIQMPVLNAQDVLQKIKVKYPKIKVIIISAFFQKSYVVECFKLGVKAFLKKGSEPEKIVEVINFVSEKGIFMDVEVSTILAEELQNSNSKPSTPSLTTKELAVINLICKGITRREAAETLNVSTETIAYHMSNIFRKTNTENVQALVKYAINKGLFNENS